MSRVKITVLKKYFDEDLAETYLAEGKQAGPCPLLNQGDVFIFEGEAMMPTGFCPWAWIDIYRGASSLAAGANTPWYKEDGEEVFCCSDGVRPVAFLLQRID